MSGDRKPIMEMTPNRRHFLAALSSAGLAGLISSSHPRAQERPPETTTIRLAKNRTLCIAPQYVVEDLLRLEGFSDIRFVAQDAGSRKRSHAAISTSLCNSRPSRCSRSTPAPTSRSLRVFMSDALREQTRFFVQAARL